MNFGIIKMTRHEYCNEQLAIREYKINFLGIPVYRAVFTSTNHDAVRLLTPIMTSKKKICGFTNNKN